MTPGDEGGPCPLCDEARVLVGYGSGVVAVYCEACDLLQPIHSDVWADGPQLRLVGEERREETVWKGEAREPDAWGPDPWG